MKNNIFTLILIAFCLNISNQSILGKPTVNIDPYSPDPNTIIKYDGYEYAWGDEFNIDGSVNKELWSFETGFKRGNEPQIYVEGDNNAIVENGRLLITAKKERRKNPRYNPASSDYRLNTEYGEYTSASINGNGKKYFLFGRIEVRARIDTSHGAFPAIWTCGQNKEWPKNGEIDIMEYYLYQNKTPSLTSNFAAGKIQAWQAIWNSKWTPLSYYTSKDIDWVNKYHVYRMDWDEKEIKLYVDDELKNQIDINDFRNEDGSICFHNPQYMWLNLALKDQGKGINITDDRNIYFEVDYFRLYQKITDNENPSTVENVEASEITDNSCRLTWNKSTDNVGIYRYDIYQGSMGSGGFIGSTKDTTFIATGLKPGSQIYMHVRALDSVGNYSFYDYNLSFKDNSHLKITTLREYDALTLPKDIYSDFILKKSLSNGGPLKWISSDPSIISNDGLVNLPEIETEITITSSYTYQKEHLVKVHPRNVNNNLILKYDFELSDFYNEDGIRYVKDKSNNKNEAQIFGNAVIDGTLNLLKNTTTGFKENGYLMLPNNILDDLRSYTVLVKIYPENLNKSPRIFDLGINCNNSIFGRLNTLCVGLKYNSNPTSVILSDTQLQTRTEQYLAYTFDAKTKISKIYIDGVEVANDNIIGYEPYQITNVGPNIRNYVGRTQWWDTSSSGSNSDFCGMIDNFHLYNIALTEDEIRKQQFQTNDNEIIIKPVRDIQFKNLYKINEPIIITNNSSEENICKIEIYNLNGEKVISEIIHNQYTDIGSICNPGVYVIKISDKDRDIFSQKIIVL